MSTRFKGKIRLFAMIIFSTFAVTVGAFSTLAWFQLDTQPISTNIVSSTPNLQVDNANVASYKIPQATNSNGFIDYNTTTTQRTVAENITIDNGNQATADTNFNVPTDGIGYYLVKKNAANTFTFSYYGNSMSWKLTHVGGTTRYYSANVELNAGDVVCVKSYNFSSHKTQITDLTLSTFNGGNSGLSDSKATIAAEDTYKVWLTESGGSWDLSLESASYTVSAFNRSAKKPTIQAEVKKANSSSNINATTVFIVNETARFDTYDIQIAVTNATYASGYGKSDLVAWFLRPDNASFNWEKPNWHSTSNCAPAGDTMYFGNKKNSSTDTHYGKYGQWREWVFPAFITSLKFKFNISDSLSSEYTATASKRNVYGYWNNSEGSGYYFNTNADVAYSFTSCTLDYYNANGSSISSSTRYQYSTFSVPSAVTTYESTPNFAGWCYNSTRESIDLVSAANLDSVSSSLNYYAVLGVSTELNTYYLYLNGQSSWSTVYCHAWGAGGYPTTTDILCTSTNVTVNGVTYKRFAVSVSEDYTDILFNNNNNYGDNNQTVNISTSGMSGKYYVLTGTIAENNITKLSGSWYASIETASQTLYDYYIFDQADYLHENNGDPYVYAWKNNVAGNGSNAFYIPHNNANAIENNAWPGAALLTTDGAGNTLPSHVYRFRISSTFDSFILNNGKENGAEGAFQTQDLSSLSTHNTTTSTPDSNTWYFVFSGKQEVDSDSDGDIDYYQVSGSWQQNVSTISLRVAFAIYDGTRYTHLATLPYNEHNGYDEIANEFYVSSVPYIPSITAKIQINGGNNYIIGDSTHGVLYYFEVPSTLVWYKDTSTWNTYDSTSGETNYSGDLYIRAVCDIRNMKTFYIDAKNWDASTLNIKNTDKSTTWLSLSSTNQVAPKLYQLTLPNSTWDFQVNYSSYYVNNGVLMSSESTTSYLTLDDNSATSGHTWRSLDAISIGNAYIQVYKNGAWDVAHQVSMDVGDIQHKLEGSSEFSNWFIYELGLRLSVDSEFRIIMETNGKASDYGLSNNETYAFDNITDYSGGSYENSVYSGGVLPSFLTDTTNGFTTTSYTGYARFNFYVSCDDEGNPRLSVAMVPDFGNGYYIMNFADTNDTSSYVGGNKMNNAANYASASYVGYYVGGETTIYIRKYIDAVDSLITSWNGAEDNCATMPTPSNGKVTIASKGYYNIQVDESGIHVSKYSGISDAFKLNPLDVTKNSTRAEIKAQKTTLFLEIPFTARHGYATSISLEVTNSLYEFVGVGLYVTTTQLTTAEIYSTLTESTYYNNLTKFSNASATSISNLNTGFTTTTAGSSATYYAYVIIDYLPTNVSNVSYTNFSNSTYINSHALGFSLIGTQA